MGMPKIGGFDTYCAIPRLVLSDGEKLIWAASWATALAKEPDDHYKALVTANESVEAARHMRLRIPNHPAGEMLRTMVGR
jgi:hypothetical protein